MSRGVRGKSIRGRSSASGWAALRGRRLVNGSTCASQTGMNPVPTKNVDHDQSARNVLKRIERKVVIEYKKYNIIYTERLALYIATYKKYGQVHYRHTWFGSLVIGARQLRPACVIS